MKKKLFFKKITGFVLLLTMLFGACLSTMHTAHAAVLGGSWQDRTAADFSLKFSSIPQEGEKFILSSTNTYIPKPADGPAWSGKPDYPTYPDDNYDWVWMAADDVNNQAGIAGMFVRGWNMDKANADGFYPLTVSNMSNANGHKAVYGWLTNGYTLNESQWMVESEFRGTSWLSWKADINSQTVSGSKGTSLKLDAKKSLNLYCHHITVYNDFSMPAESNNYDANTKTTKNAQLTVLKVDSKKKEALVHVMVPTANTQAGDSLYKFKWEVTTPEPAPIEILLTKKDAETGGAAQANLSLAGARYQVSFTDTAGKLTTWTFDTKEENGVGVIRYADDYKTSSKALLKNSAGVPALPEGTMTIQETIAPPGYELDPKTYTINFVNVNGNVQAQVDGKSFQNGYQLNTVSLEQPKKISLSITKEGTGHIPEGATLNGIRFLITNRNEGSIVVNGQTISKNRIAEILTIRGASGNTATITTTAHYPAGEYWIYELKQDADFTVGNAYGSTQAGYGTSNMANDHFLWNLNKKTIVITTDDVNAGTVFTFGTVTNSVDEKYISAKLKKTDTNGAALPGATFNLRYDNEDHMETTDENGEITWEKIPWAKAGVPATLMEVSAPSGFIIDPAYAAPGKEITIVADAGMTFILGTITNSRQLGKVIVQKSIADVDSSSKAGVKLEGFSFRLSGTSLLGETINLTATTGKDGIATLENVPFGTYTLKEELSADQAKLWKAKEAETVVISASNKEITFSLENELIRGQISLSKLDAETSDGSVQGNASLAGIKFAVVNRSGEPTFLPNGTEIENGAIAALLTTDASGKAATPAQFLPMGQYEVVELRKDSTFNIGDVYSSDNEKAGTSILANDSYLYAGKTQEAVLAYQDQPNPVKEVQFNSKGRRICNQAGHLHCGYSPGGCQLCRHPLCGDQPLR